MKRVKSIIRKFFDRNRIIILFTPLVLFPVVILSVIIISIYIQQTEKRSETVLKNSTILVAKEIEGIFENVENCSNIINLDINHSMSLLKYEFNTKIFELKLENSIKTTLDLYKSIFGDIECINYISSEGEIISTAGDIRKALNVDNFLKEAHISEYKDRYFLKWLDMQEYDLVSGESGDNHICLIRPVISLSSLENKGYIVINISERTVKAIYENLDNNFFIINEDNPEISLKEIYIDKENHLNNKKYIHERICHGDIDWYLVAEFKSDIMSKEAALVVKNMSVLTFIIMFICICIGKAFSDRQIREVERRKRKYELDIMQAQIKPHFLYNALDLIYVLCAMGNVSEAKKSTKALADFYRLSLSGGDDIISIKDELINVENYLKIQGQRYSDKFDFEIDASPLIYDYKVPKLILQPLVENSIYHGLKPKGDKGKLRISGRKCRDCAVIYVEDNGAGISKATIDMVISNNSKRKVFGLKNIVDRLELYYETSGNDIDNEGKTREAILSYDRKFRDNLYIVSKHLAIQSNYKFTRVFLILTKV